MTFRVLVADDDEWTRNLLCSYLTSEGVEVEMARNGNDAMVRFLQTQPDVVFLDVEMPGSTSNSLRRGNSRGGGRRQGVPSAISAR